jgi:hypothetical protein
MKKILGLFFISYLIYVLIRGNDETVSPNIAAPSSQTTSDAISSKNITKDSNLQTPREILLMQELSRVYSENINLFSNKYVFQQFELRGEITDIEPMKFTVRLGGSSRAATKYYVECGSTGTDPKLLEIREGQTIDFTGVLASADKTLGTLTLFMAGCVIK